MDQPCVTEASETFARCRRRMVACAVALAYEVLWTRELLNLLGSTTRASALVLAGFMAGLYETFATPQMWYFNLFPLAELLILIHGHEDKRMHPVEWKIRP